MEATALCSPTEPLSTRPLEAVEDRLQGAAAWQEAVAAEGEAFPVGREGQELQARAMPVVQDRLSTHTEAVVEVAGDPQAPMAWAT